MASDQRIRDFLKDQPDGLDVFDLIQAWERQQDSLKTFVRAVHEDLLEGDRRDSEEYPEDQYYTNAVAKYATDQDTASLEAAEELLEQNIRESYLDDGFLTDLCFEVLREEVKPAVIPDDEP